VPSASVTPDSSARSHDANTRPDFIRTLESAASAATQRPTNSGLSEAMNEGIFCTTSRQFASVTPKRSSIH
jgi:hypothetical protein